MNGEAPANGTFRETDTTKCPYQAFTLKGYYIPAQGKVLKGRRLGKE